jgi:hypothetical protein
MLSFSAIIGDQKSSTNIHALEKLQSPNRTLPASCDVDRSETSLIIEFAIENRYPRSFASLSMTITSIPAA